MKLPRGVKVLAMLLAWLALLPIASVYGGEHEARAAINLPATQPRLQLSGAVARPASFDLAALRALPAVTRTVGTNTYMGVSLWDLVSAAGVLVNPAVRNDLLGFYLVATGSDGYRTVISLAEISPGFGNQPDIVAYAMNGAPLTTNGFARLVVPNDMKAGRNVSNLVSLEVLSAAR